VNVTSAPSDRAERLPTFGRVLVGIDASPESREAARQAAVLTDPDGRLTLLAAYDVAPAIVGGTGSGTPAYFDEDMQRESAKDALERAREALAGLAEPVGKLARGNAWEELIGEIAREQHTLVAVGSHGVGRMRGILVGSTATEVIHRAPCSVLVARKAGGAFPSRIVVGVDGSPESAAAYATARHLAERFGVELSPVVAHGGKGVDTRMLAMIVGESHEDFPGSPVEALAASAADADLLVVGSRGLHGLKSLGSVSERVAHEARCSVLIVREPAWERVSEELTSGGRSNAP
jgi:nucleotide-binding universal stress UspA family protein